MFYIHCSQSFLSKINLKLLEAIQPAVITFIILVPYSYVEHKERSFEQGFELESSSYRGGGGGL